MGQSHCCGGTDRAVVPKPLDSKQISKVEVIADTYVRTYTGEAAATTVALARKTPRKQERYVGAAVPKPSLCKSAGLFLTECCRTDTTQGVQDFTVEETFDLGEVSALSDPRTSMPVSDPGPPMDAPPVSFLGPPSRYTGAGGDTPFGRRRATGRYSVKAGYDVAAAGGTDPAYDEASRRRRRRKYAYAGDGGDGGRYGGASGATAEETESMALTKIVEQEKVFNDRYILGKRLNAGAQGVTYLATSKFSGTMVVVKKPNQVDDTADYDLLAAKAHPNIVRVYELFKESAQTFVVMEHCGGGDLFHAIESLGSAVTQHWASGIFRQVLWGVRYLHSYFEQSHNDIKPENIFLDRTPDGARDVPRAMIGDFGCLAPSGQAADGGDPRYRAPETFVRARYDTSTDMWSLGATLYEIVTGGHVIYTHEHNLSSWAKFRDSGRWEALREKLVEAFPVDLDQVGVNDDSTEIEDLKTLLHGLLDTRPEKRMTAIQAIQEPWLKLDLKGEHALFDDETAVKLAERARRHVLDISLLNLVGEMLQGSSIRYYQDIWTQYDTNANGCMEYDEFCRMIEDIGLPSRAGGGAGGSGAPTMEDLFQLADANHNGTVDFNEFVGWMFDPSALSDKDRVEYLKQAFVVLANSDEKIAKEELAGFFVSSGADIAAASDMCRKLFASMDTDDSGFINFAEFSAYIEDL